MADRDSQLRQVMELLQRSQFDDAVAILDNVLASSPDDPDANAIRATLLLGANQLEAAIPYFERAAPGKLDDANFQANFAKTLVNCGRAADAESPARTALAAAPEDPFRLWLLALSLRDQNKQQEALDILENLVSSIPEDPAILNELGLCLNAQDRVSEAQQWFQQAIEINPKLPQAWHNLGNALLDQHKPNAAISAFNKAIEIEPDHAVSHVHKAYAMLLAEDFSAAWPEYEWRWKLAVPISSRMPIQSPRWDGSSQTDKTLLVYAEQGFGDTIQFSRFAGLARERVGKLVLDVQKPLKRLMEGTPGVDLVTTQDQALPPHDISIPMLSLPGALKVTPKDLPSSTAYISAPDNSQWQDILSSHRKPNIGLVWVALAETRGSIRRTIDFEEIKPLLDTTSVNWISLQKEIHGQPQPLPANLIDVSGRLSDFADTATLISKLDLIITVDTAVAHLAGALGKPVWILLTTGCDWRWSIEGLDCPWYPSARLFRKNRQDGWPEVVQQVSNELQKFVTA